MNRSLTAFTNKAENYARYRWDYAQPAIETIFSIAGLSNYSTIVDLGAGTGILTRHFTGRTARLYAIEPNAAMRFWARQTLAGVGGCILLGGCAENIPLLSGSVDLVVVAQAIHWFDPETAPAEIWRLLRPGGWLAILRNYCIDEVLNRAVESILTPENGIKDRDSMPGKGKNLPDLYFNQPAYRTFTYQFELTQDWPAFLGNLASASYTPEKDDPHFISLERAAWAVFEQMSKHGKLDVAAESELVIGQVSSLSIPH